MNRLVKIVLLSCMTLMLATGSWAAEKNMVFASPYGITTLDPSVSYSTELGYMANIYETLIRVNPPGSEELFEFVLATAYTASKDGLEYTFKLRKALPVVFEGRNCGSIFGAFHTIDGCKTDAVGIVVTISSFTREIYRKWDLF